MREVTLRRAEVSYSGALADIASSSGYCAHWGAADFEGEIGNKFAGVYAAFYHTKLVGFIAFRFCCEEAEITNFALAPDFRGRGIGALLLSHAIKTAAGLGIKRITLEVNEHNRAALALYGKFDFKRVGTRRKFYDNTHDAVLMLREI